MSNIIRFVPKEKSKPVPKDFSCSLNRALLTVQYCVYVLEDITTAQNILQQLTTSYNLGERVTLPGEFRDVVEHVDTAATYRAVLGVRDE
jgi:hypothetical protein